MHINASLQSPLLDVHASPFPSLKGFNEIKTLKPLQPPNPYTLITGQGLGFRAIQVAIHAPFHDSSLDSSIAILPDAMTANAARVLSLFRSFLREARLMPTRSRTDFIVAKLRHEVRGRRHILVSSHSQFPLPHTLLSSPISCASIAASQTSSSSASTFSLWWVVRLGMLDPGGSWWLMHPRRGQDVGNACWVLGGKGTHPHAHAQGTHGPP